jgi:hypothetical protein
MELGGWKWVYRDWLGPLFVHYGLAMDTGGILIFLENNFQKIFCQKSCFMAFKTLSSYSAWHCIILALQLSKSFNFNFLTMTLLCSFNTYVLVQFIE